jgi:hypothetical protein
MTNTMHRFPIIKHLETAHELINVMLEESGLTSGVLAFISLEIRT